MVTEVVVAFVVLLLGPLAATVPPRCTAVGFPARIIKGAGTDNPAQTMDETLAQGTYESFTYVI